MSSRQTTTQEAKPYAAAAPLLDQGLSDAQALYNQGGFNITPFQGDLVAPTDPFSSMAYDMAPGAVGGAMQGNQAAQAGLMRALDPSLRSGAFDQVRQNTIDAIMPSINSTFAGSGMTGSTLHAQNLAKGLAAGLGGVENQAFQQGEARALQAAGMMPGLNQASMAPINYLRDLGQERQRQSQAEIQANVLQDQQAKTAELQAIQDYLSIAGQAGSAFGVQSSTQSRSPGIMGLAGLGLQAAPLLFPSDRRLKRDIVRIGERNGLPWYSFNYHTDAKEDAPRHGFMSDDVRAVMPDAVIVGADGFDLVNYTKALGA